jgi:hypothetical protein
MTSTMLSLADASGGQSVLRLMTKEPWRKHGPGLTRREQAAQRELAAVDDNALVAMTELLATIHDLIAV